MTAPVSFKRVSIGSMQPRIGLFMLDLSQADPYPTGGYDFTLKGGGEPSTIIAVGMIVYNGTGLANPFKVAIDPATGKLRLFQLNAAGTEFAAGTAFTDYPPAQFLVVF